MRQREKLVPLASGRVLEVGMGSGLNLPFYDARRVTKVWGLEPSPEMSKMASAAVEAVAFDVEFVSAGGEQIPLDSESFDTVLMTFTLCTIPERALREIARVLKRGGQLLFCEHGAAPDAGVRRWQNRINPLWRRLAGGCHLNRDIPGLIRRGGFEITRMDNVHPRLAPCQLQLLGRCCESTSMTRRAGGPLWPT